MKLFCIVWTGYTTIYIQTQPERFTSLYDFILAGNRVRLVWAEQGEEVVVEEGPGQVVIEFVRGGCC